MAEELIVSSDSHVFEPPDLWTTRIDPKFRGREPRMKRVGEVDHLVIEDDQTISGIGLISNAGARFDAPETISDHGKFDDVLVGGYEPEEHIRDMKIDGVSGEVLYPSQGLFYFGIEDSDLTSAVFRTYNDWLSEFCSTNPQRLKGIAMINLDDVQEGIAELERAAGLGLVGAMICEYPAEERRYYSPEYEPFWAAAEQLRMPLSLHTATKRYQSNFATGAISDATGAGQQGVLAFGINVRHDLFRRVREISRPEHRNRRVRDRLGGTSARHHGLHLPRAPRGSHLPIQGRKDALRFLPRKRFHQLPGGRHRNPPEGRDRG